MSRLELPVGEGARSIGCSRAVRVADTCRRFDRNCGLDFLRVAITRGKMAAACDACDAFEASGAHPAGGGNGKRLVRVHAGARHAKRADVGILAAERYVGYAIACRGDAEYGVWHVTGNACERAFAAIE